MPGVAVHYSWPSAAEPLGYVYDRDSMMFARAGLEQLIREVIAAGATRVTLVAHSMGSFLTMETLRSMALRDGQIAAQVRGVVLIGRDAALIRDALNLCGVPMQDADSLPAAVRLAKDMAQSGDAVLMSPACASLDMFKNYEHRAQVFCQAVAELADEAGVSMEGGL